MFGASLYIIRCSLKNRMRRWVLRLREPRYLLALLAGLAYLYFVAWTQFRVRSNAQQRSSRRGFPQNPLASLGATAVVAPAFAGLALLLVSAGAWLFPGAGTLLEFSKAETQFLFSAPVPPRHLIVYRMMRSQAGVLFGSLVFALLLPFGMSSGSRVRTALTVWLVLFAARVYASGVALARARLTSRAPADKLLARVPLMLIVFAVVAVLLPLGRSLFASAPLEGVSDALSRASALLTSGRSAQALWVFAALARPMFVDSWRAFAEAAVPALAITGVLVGWVLASGQTFDELSREVAESRKDLPQKKKTAYRVRKLGWTLAPLGRPEPAFLWKAMLQTTRVVQVRIFIRMAIFVMWMAVIASASGRDVSATLGIFAMIFAGIATVMGPLILRIDLRQDLQHLEVLKTWPVKASALVRGQMMWPGLILTGIVWLMTLTAFYVSTAVFTTSTLALRAGAAVAVCLVAPALIAAQLALHNSIALVFPAWVSFGSFRARGVDAVGQRLIVVGASILLVGLAAVPGGLVGGAIFLVFQRFVGPLILIPAGAACAAIIGLEVLLVTEAIGPAYERLDLTSIERAES